MPYAVTFCATDTQVESNVFWHSCILLSQLNEETKQMEVVDTWGFYGLRSTNPPDSWSEKIKKAFGLSIILSGNHGMFRHEELRFLDRGYGLHGVTFELTEEKFNTLQQICLQRVAEQEQAIQEVVASQGIQGKSPDKTKIYSHEEVSHLIFGIEKVKAEQQKREPRLKPFELQLSWGLWGPGFEKSSTCKSQILSILSQVLTPEQINRLTENGKHPTIPRFSGPKETIHLHSMGPEHRHTKSSGKIVSYRKHEENVRLFWTLPPQMLDATDETLQLLQLEEQYVPQVKAIIEKLQRLEWLIRDAVIPTKYETYRAGLIHQIIEHYRAFSIIEPKQASPQLSLWKQVKCSLFSLPKTQEEKRLQNNIQRANDLLNVLYLALVEGWKIEEQQDYGPAASSSSRESGSEYYKGPFELLVTYLTREDKERVCHILGRSYFEEKAVEEPDNDTFSLLDGVR